MSEDTPSQCRTDGCTNDTIADWGRCWNCFASSVDYIAFTQSVDDAKANVDEFFSGDE